MGDNMNRSVDKTRIQRAIEGNQNVFLESLLEYRLELHRFVANKISDSPNIKVQEDDILQETYIRACREVGSLRVDNKQGLMAWLKAIALNQIRDAARRQSAAKRGGDVVKVEIDQQTYSDRAFGLAIELSDPGGQSPSSYVARRESIDAIRIALSQLPEDQRTAIQLRFFQLCSLDETAERMSRTSDSVRGLLQRAKKSLREAMITSSLWLSKHG